MADIKEAIMDKLRETEQNYDVKIPLAIESGSRAWGFASPDSDYDCRFIYVHRKDWYVSVFEKKDFIEYAVDPVFDVNGWDLKKVLLHITKSNAVMLEWLASNEIYIKDNEIVKPIQTLAEEFFNPIGVSYHYLSIAKNKLGEILSEDSGKLKKYFYVLRPLANLQYIRQNGKIPYMEYDRTLADIEIAPEIVSAIEELKKVKVVSDESYQIPTHQLLVTYFQKEVAYFAEYLKGMKFEKKRDYDRVDQVFRETIEKIKF